jgi:tRNA(Ile)-lysidine synthase
VEKLAGREKDGLLFRLEAEAFLDPERLLYAFRHLLEEEMGARLPYGAVLSRLAELAKSGGMGESLSLPGRLQARKEADGLFFFFPGRVAAPAGETILPDPPFAVRVGDLAVTAQWLPQAGAPPGDDRLDPMVEWLNPAALRWPLRLGPARPGDRFHPLGAPGSKKVADYLSDHKVPQRKRGQVVTLSDHAGIVWLWPHRLAHRVRVEGVMVKALRISIVPTSAE